MKVVSVSINGLEVDLFRSKRDAAFDAGIERTKFAKLLERDGSVLTGEKCYMLPTER